MSSEIAIMVGVCVVLRGRGASPRGQSLASLRREPRAPSVLVAPTGLLAFGWRGVSTPTRKPYGHPLKGQRGSKSLTALAILLSAGAVLGRPRGSPTGTRSRGREVARA